MLTPRFSCSQTENTVIISTYVPSVRVNVEIHVQDNLFSLHINPYFLRLNFPKRVQEDDSSSALYDPSTGVLTVTLSKETPGENFEDLDLLAVLLAPKQVRRESHPVIEVVDQDEGGHEPPSDTKAVGLRQEYNIFLEAEKNDWLLLPSLSEIDQPQFAATQQRRYGFLDMHAGYFRHPAHMANEATDLGSDAELLCEDERRRRGEERVDKKFDEDHYLADFVNDKEICEFLQWQHPYFSQHASPLEFSEEEKLVILHLPRKEYLATTFQTRSLYFTLLAILFSAAYDSRTTLADPTTESAWTICVLTPAFASLSIPHAASSASSIILDTFIPSYKRALAFPLYRSFALCERCRLDVADILGAGRRAVLKSLLNIKSILDKHEVYYLYSKIWVDDYCVWIQRLASEQTLHRLSAEVRKVNVKKQDLGWELEVLERAAKEVMEATPDSDDEALNEVEGMQPALL